MLLDLNVFLWILKSNRIQVIICFLLFRVRTENIVDLLQKIYTRVYQNMIDFAFFLEIKQVFHSHNLAIVNWLFPLFFTDARSLISWMLSRDPDARPTLEQVRRHPWIYKRHWGACPGLPWAGHAQQVQGGTCKSKEESNWFQASREVNIRIVCQRFPSAGLQQALKASAKEQCNSLPSLQIM